ncbi:MAG: helix-turn-helix domain-containing protein [Terracidiphilus sp.]
MDTSINKPISGAIETGAAPNGGFQHPFASRLNAVSQIGEQLMTAIEVAGVLRTSERYVRDHTTRRFPKIRAVCLGKLIRYRRSDVDEFIVQLSTDPTSRSHRSRG